MWDLANGGAPRPFQMPDVCGLAPARHAGCFRLTNGTGAVVDADVTGSEVHIRPVADTALQWDNHLTLFSRG
ncbi:MAG: DUF1513 domain-containing protein [Rhodospirillaceae bacterium]